MGTSNSTRETVEETISDWPDKPKKTAESVLDKYGDPDEATLERQYFFSVDYLALTCNPKIQADRLRERSNRADATDHWTDVDEQVGSIGGTASGEETLMLRSRRSTGPIGRCRR